MSESALHMALTAALVRWVAERYFDGDEGRILVDCPEGHYSRDNPPRIGGYTPDVFANQMNGQGNIVGEAKTACDLENCHTRAQLAAFLDYCVQNDATLVMAVPWYAERLAKAMIRNIQRRRGGPPASVVVLERLSG
jgi:hypothetical protein